MLDVWLGLHVETKTGNNGACLSRHTTNCCKNNSCSHRWQAYRTALAHPGKYKTPTALVKHKKKKYRPIPDERNKKVVSPKAWDLEEVSMVYRRPKGSKGADSELLTVKNFRERADVPYPRNAHHIIPNSVLNKALYSAGKESTDLFLLTRISLLQAKYNLNYKSNLILLPIDRVIAKAMGLPRHISGKDADSTDNRETQNHSTYNDEVYKVVSKIVRNFARQISKVNHDIELKKLGKAKLERYSKKVMTRLFEWGGGGKGAALNKAPKRIFEHKVYNTGI